MKTLSRWENGAQAISKQHDLLLRLIYCTIKGIPAEERANLIQEEFPVNEESFKDFPPYIIPQTEWGHSHSCSSNYVLREPSRESCQLSMRHFLFMPPQSNRKKTFPSL